PALPCPAPPSPYVLVGWSVHVTELRQALEELLRAPNACLFAQPVDPERDRCPDYLEVIERPMDLG
ncbi:unnamed protein product, partial [Discosporangium mesarthrocarpum]